MAASIRHLYRPAVSVCVLAALVLPAAGLAANPRGGAWTSTELGKLEAELAWYFPMPLPSVVSISSYTVLDGYLYATGTDGKVRALRADTGEFLWTAQIARPGTRIWGPSASQANGSDEVVFTLLAEAVFVDRDSGFLIRQMDLKEAAIGPVAVSSEALYSASVARHLTKYDLKSGLLKWRAALREETSVPPLFIPERKIVVAVDGTGHVYAGTEEREVLFKVALDQPATGWLAVRDNVLYVTTRGVGGSVHALDLATGQPVRDRLPLDGAPQGGPVVTATGVYQAMYGGGLRHLPLKQGGKDWTYPAGKQFLAEWGDRLAVLSTDGRFEILETATGQRVGAIAGEKFRAGISNTLNDAAIVASAGGDIRCLRPAGAPRLTLASFRPVTTQPATQPATTPTEEAAPAEPTEQPAEPTEQPTEPAAPTEESAQPMEQPTGEQ